MALPNIFDPQVAATVIARVKKLTNSSQPVWGKMTVAQMLAHCNVTYELVYEDKHPQPNFFMKFFLKAFVKKMVTNEAPYKRNSQTAPFFLIKDERDFEREKARLVNYIEKTQQLGASHFDNKDSFSFGRLSYNEWNNMFYKHLDHHLQQFGA